MKLTPYALYLLNKPKSQPVDRHAERLRYRREWVRRKRALQRLKAQSTPVTPENVTV